MLLRRQVGAAAAASIRPDDDDENLGSNVFLLREIRDDLQTHASDARPGTVPPNATTADSTRITAMARTVFSLRKFEQIDDRDTGLLLLLSEVHFLSHLRFSFSGLGFAGAALVIFGSGFSSGCYSASEVASMFFTKIVIQCDKQTSAVLGGFVVNSR